MLQLTNKKRYLLYVFLFLILSTFNNLNITKSNFFQVKEIKVTGLDKAGDSEVIADLKKRLSILKNKNIFSIKKNLAQTEVFKNKWVSEVSIQRKYPSQLNVIVKKAAPIANIIVENNLYFVGSNFKLIKTQNLNKDLPNIFGKPTMLSLSILINQINKSNFDYQDIQEFYHLKSGRWDIKTNKDILIKLPKENILESLDFAYELINNQNFLIKKKINLTVKNQLIIN
jgi:cell division protein FtsQ